MVNDGGLIIRKRGFTIVEILVVIVTISILAAITIASYSGISVSANVAVVSSDLTNASKQLRLYQALYSSYPTAMSDNCPTMPVDDSKYCLKSSPDTTLVYSSTSPKTFHLTETKNSISYSITDNTSLAIATTVHGSTVGRACPTGFIPVPGSGTYGTNDFCVMKYEAKADDNGDGIGDTTYNDGSNSWSAMAYPISSSRKLVSSAAGYPIVKITQPTAIAISSTIGDVYDCDSGCHLITEAEWMTLAQNVISVASNWSGGSVGNGYIYSGHNDNKPANALEADTNDLNGYAGETNTGGNQRRTLTLTNGQVIWDLAGNIQEWTSGKTNNLTAQQPGINGLGYANREYSALTNGGSFDIRVNPVSTGINGADSWVNNGVGRIYSSSDDSSQRGFLRSGYWNYCSSAGVFYLHLGYAPNTVVTFGGLRVAR